MFPSDTSLNAWYLLLTVFEVVVLSIAGAADTTRIFGFFSGTSRFCFLGAETKDDQINTQYALVLVYLLETMTEPPVTVHTEV